MRDRDSPRGGGRAYTEWAANRQAERRKIVDRQRDLSRRAQDTRRPGQTLQHRLRELEAVALIAPMGEGADPTQGNHG